MSWQIVLVCAALAVPVGLAICLWLRFRNETRNTRNALDKHAEALAEINSLGSRLASLELQVQQINEQRASHAEWVSSSESLNLNRRGQVLRLHGRGDSVPAIADALHMRQGEVQLMIKVHELSRDFLKTKQEANNK
jgi:hypothetical protein